MRIVTAIVVVLLAGASLRAQETDDPRVKALTEALEKATTQIGLLGAQVQALGAKVATLEKPRPPAPTKAEIAAAASAEMRQALLAALDVCPTWGDGMVTATTRAGTFDFSCSVPVAEARKQAKKVK